VSYGPFGAYWEGVLMVNSRKGTGQEITAIKVKQWLREWNAVSFSSTERRRRPEPHFFIFSLSAAELRALSGIQRRQTKAGELRSEDLGIQRRHDEKRSEEISRFIRYGYPWSNLSKARRASGEFRELRKPGWLPTAVVVNILRAEDQRRGVTVAAQDLVKVADGEDNIVRIQLPTTFTGSGWKPETLHPVEVIDGQHRLWAFEGDDAPEDFELPVVAFYGLDISWQAYLFWTINIKPKRINPSLAFDLYPLLRTENWLEKFEGPAVYRETRAQELTEMMWSQPESPWHHRINMLGEAGMGAVSQAAWIRALLATYVRSFEGPGVRIGGLFGAPVGADKLVLPWSRQQQGAFLITVWTKMQKAVADSTARWAEELRRDGKTKADAAFAGPNTLLNQDQGVRAFLHITNDLTFVRNDELKLRSWSTETSSEEEIEISQAIESLPPETGEFLNQVANSLAEFDWRTVTAERLTEEEILKKLVFRGSGGYSEFRRQLLKHVSSGRGQSARAANLVLKLEPKKEQEK
jgi:DGQHR domain-containing protein